MATICISNNREKKDTGLVHFPRSAKYVNLYKWPESELLIRTMSSPADEGGGGGGGHSGKYNYLLYPPSTPRLVDSASCRQLYLRSAYTFSRKQSVHERTKKCFGKVKERVGVATVAAARKFQSRPPAAAGGFRRTRGSSCRIKTRVFWFPLKLSMESSADEYEEFKERVRRTIYVDNLSPQVTEAILKAAFEQFCDVVNIKFIPNSVYPSHLPCAALLEVKTESSARAVVEAMSSAPFMICGMPRPVRVCAAEEGMFDDRPTKPDRRMTFQWLDEMDPKFQIARRMKNLTRRHANEAEYLLKHQLEDAEKLHRYQDEILKANSNKYEMIDEVVVDGTADKLAQRYNIRLVDC
ncbi:OLC1v1034725C1 [Oldenlandia corymbosa var. corymbosa]|uniref:OLC1v1034725C1 n=1 Tax=Oldenlandia corymbosa var. corymbosa TaxID=529605 RepID=A0AAV1CS10_OLDCO|nr:OLC1v1034725C1 [Oldenlandia corymbosa var. corymbosa]